MTLAERTRAHDVLVDESHCSCIPERRADVMRLAEERLLESEQFARRLVGKRGIAEGAEGVGIDGNICIEARKSSKAQREEVEQRTSVIE